MPNGCTKCLDEFKGWLKAFTPIELLLTVLEAILLVVLLIFIVFFILHLFSCNRKYQNNETTTERHITTRDDNDPTKWYTDSTTASPLTRPRTRPTCTYTANQTASTTKQLQHTEINALPSYSTPTAPYENVIMSVSPDGLPATEDQKAMAVALVKIKPTGVTFGCILTALSEFWAITAASCIDSIEEVDSLDNFVLLPSYGNSSQGRPFIVADVRVHPQYQGGNGSFDLALVKAGGALGRLPAQLPTLLDYFRYTIGVNVNILGFGMFRTIDGSASSQQLRSASLHILPSIHCSPPAFEERHLIPLPGPVTHGHCGLSPLCVGVMYERGNPCNYCSGSPLLKGNVLLGIMADNEQCGSSCEPALYANVAAVRNWIRYIMAS